MEFMYILMLVIIYFLWRTVKVLVTITHNQKVHAEQFGHILRELRKQKS